MTQTRVTYIRQRFDDHAARYGHNFITQRIGRSEMATLRAMIPPADQPGKTPALDFGCGAGRSASLLLDAGYCVTGYDISEKMLARAQAALGHLHAFGIILLLGLAAILGDTVNYSIGKFVGPRVFQQDSRFVRKEHLDRTHLFFEKYGRKTILLARFVPIIRTFAPFVAGIGEMPYSQFTTYNILGGVTWVTLLTLAGFWFGHFPVVRDHFSLAILAVIGISLIPAVAETLKARFSPPEIETI